VGAVDRHREALRAAADPGAYLASVSGLPGPRGNIEAARAAAEELDAGLLLSWARLTPEEAPENTPAEMLVVAGLVGVGRLVAEGRTELPPILREAAGDARWRVREGVAMALQRLGAADPAATGRTARAWVGGTPLESRAAVAAVAEPALLRRPADARRAIAVVDAATAALVAERDRRRDDVRVLRKALAYAWSVVVAAEPVAGRPAMERWLAVPDPDVRWLMRQNLAKARLGRADAAWTARWRAALEHPA
jgi:hypothetical protein